MNGVLPHGLLDIVDLIAVPVGASVPAPDMLTLRVRSINGQAVGLDATAACNASIPSTGVIEAIVRTPERPVIRLSGGIADAKLRSEGGGWKRDFVSNVARDRRLNNDFRITLPRTCSTPGDDTSAGL